MRRQIRCRQMTALRLSYATIENACIGQMRYGCPTKQGEIPTHKTGMNPHQHNRGKNRSFSSQKDKFWSMKK